MKNEIIINGVTYVKKEEKKQSKRDNGFWYYDVRGVIYNDKDTPLDVYKPFVFPTEAECINGRDKTLALYRIKEYAEDKWGEFIPDWNNDRQYKWYLVYSHITEKYLGDCCWYINAPFPIYIEKEEHCKEIIERFKDDLDILFDIK
jgi:hypothetical protein